MADIGIGSQLATAAEEASKGIGTVNTSADALASSIEKAAGNLDKFKDILDKIKNGTGSINELMSILSENTRDLSEQEVLRIKSLAEEVKLMKQAAESGAEELENLENQISKTDNLIEKRKIAIQIAQKQLQMAIAAGTLDAAQIEAARKYIKELKEELDLLEKKQKTTAKIVENLSKGTKEVLALVNTLSLGSLEAVRSIFTLSGWGQRAAEVMQKTANANSVLAATVGKVGEAGLAFSENFSKGLSNYGVTITEAAGAYSELFKTYSGFSNLDTTTRENLAKTTATLKNLNISASDVGKNFDIITKSLGYAEADMERINTELRAQAVGAGIDQAKMVKEFASSMDRLAVYGQRAPEIYARLQKAAKHLGMELSSLNGIVGEQFDTFENSARAAGKLNALLGGNYLNSVEMMNATEEDRIVILKRSLEASGKNFASLNRWEQKAIAASLGIKNLSEANNLLGKSSWELEAAMAEAAAKEEDMNKAKEQAAELQTRLNAIMLDFFKIIEPLVSRVESFIKWLSEFSEKEKEVVFWTSLIIGLLTAFSAGYFFKKVLEGFIDKLISKLSGIKSVAAEAGEGIKEGIENAAESGPKARQFGKDLLYLGGAILGIGAGIGLAAWGLSKLVQAFTQTTQAGYALGAVALVLAAFAIYIKLLGKAGESSQAGLYAVAVAMLAVGGAIAIASFGLSFLVSSFEKLSDEKATAAMWTVVSVMGGFVLALFGLAIAAKLLTSGGGSIAIGILAAVLLALGLAIALIGGGIYLFVESISKMADIKFSAIKELGSSMKEVGSAFKELGELIVTDKSEKIINWFISIGTSLDTASSRMSVLSSSMMELNKLFTDENALSSFEAGIVKLKDSIAELSTVMQELEGSKFVTLTGFVQSVSAMDPAQTDQRAVSIQNLVTTIKNSTSEITNEKIEPTKKFIETITKYYEVKNTVKESSDDKLLQAIRLLTNKVEASSSTKDEEKTVTLIIKGADWKNSDFGKKPIHNVNIGVSDK